MPRPSASARKGPRERVSPVRARRSSLAAGSRSPPENRWLHGHSTTRIGKAIGTRSKLARPLHHRALGGFRDASVSRYVGRAIDEFRTAARFAESAQVDSMWTIRHTFSTVELSAKRSTMPQPFTVSSFVRTHDWNFRSTNGALPCRVYETAIEGIFRSSTSGRLRGGGDGDGSHRGPGTRVVRRGSTASDSS